MGGIVGLRPHAQEAKRPWDRGRGAGVEGCCRADTTAPVPRASSGMRGAAPVGSRAGAAAAPVPQASPARGVPRETGREAQHSRHPLRSATLWRERGPPRLAARGARVPATHPPHHPPSRCRTKTEHRTRGRRRTRVGAINAGAGAGQHVLIVILHEPYAAAHHRVSPDGWMDPSWSQRPICDEHRAPYRRREGFCSLRRRGDGSWRC